MIMLCGADKTRRGNRTPTNGPALPNKLPGPPPTPTFAIHVHDSTLVKTVSSLTMSRRKASDASLSKSLPFLPHSPSPSTVTLEITQSSSVRTTDQSRDEVDGGRARRGSIPEELLSPATTSEFVTPGRSLSNPPFHRPTASWERKDFELVRIGSSRDRVGTPPRDSDTASESSRTSSKRSRPPPITIPPFHPAHQKSIIQRDDEPERPLPSISRRHSRQTPPSTGPPTRISPPILLPSILPLAPLSMARRNSPFPEDAEGRISVDVDGDFSRRRISIAASSRRPSQISSQGSGSSSRKGSIPSDLDTRVYASRTLVSPPTEHRRRSSRSPHPPRTSHIASPSNSSLSPPSSSTPSSHSSASSYVLPSVRPLHARTTSLDGHNVVSSTSVDPSPPPRRWETVALAEANEGITPEALEALIKAGLDRIEEATSRIVIDVDGIERLVEERRRGKQRLEELRSQYEVETRERERVLARCVTMMRSGGGEEGERGVQGLMGVFARSDRLTREILSVHASMADLVDVQASHERSIASLSISKLHDSLLLSHENDLNTHHTLVQVTSERDEALRRLRTLEDKLRGFADEEGEVRMAIEPSLTSSRSIESPSTTIETPRTTVSFRLSDLRIEIKKFPQPPLWPAPPSVFPRPYRFPTSPSSTLTTSPLPPAPPPKPISSLPPASYNSRTLRPPPTRKSSKVVGAILQTLDVLRRGGGGEGSTVPDEGKVGRRWRSASEPAIFASSGRVVYQYMGEERK